MSEISISLTDCFKPEDRARGQDLFDRDLVYVSSAADTSVKAMIKASGAPRVSLHAEDVSDASFVATCNCTSFAKGSACKHVWAVLLKLSAIDADFLESKTDVQLATIEIKPKRNEAQQRRLDEQKERAKQMRREKKAAEKGRGPAASIHPEPVQEALAYFAANGFDLAADLDIEHVYQAKRTLARVFHPDKGGSHDEAVELARNVETLRDYLNG